MSERRFRTALAAIALTGWVVRAAYVAAQPATDPDFARPILDGAYYVEWARALASGGHGPSGAFYLAPLYPWTLAGLFAVAGERFGLLYALQHALVAGGAVFLGLAARRAAGEASGLAAAAVALLYHPALYFGSRPIAEPLGLALLAAAVWAGGTGSIGANGAAGLLAGLSALARPNLLLVPLVWGGVDAAGRRTRTACALLAGVAVAVLPVSVRNRLVSGHWVPVSSNAGITLYHGNGPGARGGFTLPEAFTGRVVSQREEATMEARRRAGRPLDDVEADAWWGREALRVRSSEPAGTLALLGRRVFLLVDSAELGLDYAPALDRNPWRRAAPLGFATLIGLAVAGLVVAGRTSGGGRVWGAIAACAAAPVVFYASSRYRLPMAWLLSVPAGIGLVKVLAPGSPGARGRVRVAAVLAGLASAAASAGMPSRDLTGPALAGALANRAASWQAAGDLERAEKDARRAADLDPASSSARFTLGAVLEARGRVFEGERAYREALRIDPGHPQAAGNLGRLLIERASFDEAVATLRGALARAPADAVLRTNLIAALVLRGDAAGARVEVEAAARAGVALDPGLVEAVRRAGSAAPGAARKEEASP